MPGSKVQRPGSPPIPYINCIGFRMLARNGDATRKSEDKHEDADEGSADDGKTHECHVVPKADTKSNKGIHYG